MLLCKQVNRSGIKGHNSVLTSLTTTSHGYVYLLLLKVQTKVHLNRSAVPSNRLETKCGETKK